MKTEMSSLAGAVTTVTLLLVLAVPSAFSTRADALRKEGPALRNEDIVAMTRAHLGEGLILTAIEHTPSHFSTNAEALIALKGAGVGDAILAAMVKANDAGREREARAAAYLAAQPGITWLGEDGPRRLQKAAVAVGSAHSFRSLIPGLGTTTTALFLGSSASLRVTNPRPAFEVKNPSDAPIAGKLLLFRLTPATDHRQLDRFTASASGLDLGANPAKDLVPLTIEAIADETATAHGLAVYQVRLPTPLAPGEYAFLFGTAWYDFGVDARDDRAPPVPAAAPH